MEVGHRGHRVLHWVGGPRGGVAVGWEVRRGTRAEVGCELVTCVSWN